MTNKHFVRSGRSLMALMLCLFVFAASVPAQSRRSSDRFGDKLFDIRVSEIVLESIDFRDQTARMNLGLEIKNPLIPISLKDFEYNLRLFGLETISGNHDGTMRLGGRDPSRIDLPLEINLRSVPGVVWSAFSNRGRLKFDLDTAFTIPLIVFEKRFDKSFSGEVPLKTLVDAASILRARRLGGVVFNR